MKPHPARAALAFRGTRLSEGALVQAHVEGRVLGIRLLKIDALVSRVPALTDGHISEGTIHQPVRLSRTGSARPGSALGEAIQSLDEAAELLSER